MCFDTKTSALYFIVGLISSFCIKYLPLKLFVFVYSFIQLYEFMVWSNPVDSIENKVGTIIGKYTLPLHAAMFGLGIYLVTGESIPLIFGIISYICVILLAYKNDYLQQTKLPVEGKRLEWPFCNIWYIATTLIIILSTLLYSPTKYIVLLIIGYIGTIVYSCLKSDTGNEFSSLWCFSAAYIAPFLALADNLL